MAKAATRAKQKWNDAHYSQIKVSVPKNIADMYRAKCANMGVSMASDIITHITGEPVAKTAFPIENRGQRRKSAEKLISTLAAIRDAEEQYMNNIPCFAVSVLKHRERDGSAGRIHFARPRIILYRRIYAAASDIVRRNTL